LAVIALKKGYAAPTKAFDENEITKYLVTAAQFNSKDDAWLLQQNFDCCKIRKK